MAAARALLKGRMIYLSSANNSEQSRAQSGKERRGKLQYVVAHYTHSKILSFFFVVVIWLQEIVCSVMNLQFGQSGKNGFFFALPFFSGVAQSIIS